MQDHVGDQEAEDSEGRANDKFAVIEHKENCCVEFWEEIRRSLGGTEVLPDDRAITAKLLSDKASKVHMGVIKTEDIIQVSMTKVHKGRPTRRGYGGHPCVMQIAAVFVVPKTVASRVDQCTGRVVMQ